MRFIKPKFILAVMLLATMVGITHASDTSFKALNTNSISPSDKQLTEKSPELIADKEFTYEVIQEPDITFDSKLFISFDTESLAAFFIAFDTESLSDFLRGMKKTGGSKSADTQKILS